MGKYQTAIAYAIKYLQTGIKSMKLNDHPPRRSCFEIEQSLLQCGFDPQFNVSVWEETDTGFRFTGKVSLVIAISCYEWAKANEGKKFPASIHKVQPSYIFPLEFDPNNSLKEQTLMLCKH